MPMPLCTFFTLSWSQAHFILATCAMMDDVAKTFTIQEKWATKIFQGEKLFEIRPREKKYIGLRDLSNTPLVGWHWYRKQRLITRLLSVREFSSVETCLSTLGVNVVIPGGATMSDALETWMKAINLNFSRIHRLQQ